VSQLVDEIWAVFQDTPVAFTLGVLVGFALSSRYRVVKRKRKEDADA
jgi:hypothetical protein